MGKLKIDITNQTFGKLTAIEYIGDSKWKCLCSCGNYAVATSSALKRGERKSCGCLKKKYDHIGERFGRLLVVGEAEEKVVHGQQRSWICRCDCGKTTIVKGSNLRNGITNSCGCLALELASKRAKINAYKHGDSHERLYKIWLGMKERCLNPNTAHYDCYGGRGITLCEEWLDYPKFKEWAINNGYNEGLTIDRIDVNGNYCPENCRWTTKKEQAQNRRTTLHITFNGEIKTIHEWSQIFGIREKLIWSRIYESNWSVEKALTTPVRR